MNKFSLGTFAGEKIFIAVEGEAAQKLEELAQHIHQQTNGDAKPKLPPRCIIGGCFNDALEGSVFCNWHTY